MIKSNLIPLFSSWQFLTVGPYEKDQEFKKLLTDLAQKGLFVYAILGIFIACIYIISYALIAGENISWSLSNVQADEMLILDKVGIILVCLIMLLFSKISVPLSVIRVFVFFVSLIGSLLMIIENIVTLDFSFTTPYTTLALFFAIAIVPYKGWQTVLICISLISINLMLVFVAPTFIEGSLVPLKPSQFIYLFAMCVLLIFMSSQIYLNRFRQYQARKRAGELVERIESQKDKILENEKLKDRFFTNVNHELRTPLTLILGPLTDIERANEGEDTVSIKSELLRIIRRNGQRLLNLINQLLDLSKIDELQIQLDIKKVDFAELIKSTVEEFHPIAKSHNISLSLEFYGEDLIAFLDPQQMQKVIRNLLSNAIKYSPDNSKIEIVASKKNSFKNGLQIVIRDTGYGIPSSDLAHIFDRFYIGTHAPIKKDIGAGVGLALVKEIINLHQGKIHAKSKVGVGSEFVIELPDNQQMQDGYTYEEGESLDEDFIKDMGQFERHTFEADMISLDNEVLSESASTVLLIDDNPDILNYLSPYLGNKYQVLTEKNGENALKVLEQREIDLVISDVMMPIIDGFELCKTIKNSKEWNHIPVILLTARASDESKIEGLELGADDYIMKPFSATELMIRAENLIEIRKTLQEKFSEEIHLKGQHGEVASEDARLLKSIQDTIDDHIGNSNFGVAWLADEVNLSKRHLHRKIQSITGMSAGGYIRMLRLEKAGHLLKQNWGNINEIAYRVGFQSPKYFSRLFKQTYGVTPSEFISKK